MAKTDELERRCVAGLIDAGAVTCLVADNVMTSSVEAPVTLGGLVHPPRRSIEMSMPDAAKLDANGHLADGEVCTLLPLKLALRKVGTPWAGDELPNV